MDAPSPFRYRPVCSEPGCEETAVYKVAAYWSDGSHHELKNYGLACPAHRDSRLDRARTNRDALKLGPGETVGDVRLFVLDPSRRDTEQESVADAPAPTPPPSGPTPDSP